MRVSSPIGELPFEPRRIHYRERALHVDGDMGAWPADVVIEAGDLPALARLVATPAVITAAAVAIVGVVAIARRKN